MKKYLLAGLGIYLLASASAFARVDLGINLGVPVVAPAPVYVAPAPVYVAPPPPVVYAAPYPYYDPYHRGHVIRYWHDRGYGHPGYYHH